MNPGHADRDAEDEVCQKCGEAFDELLPGAFTIEQKIFEVNEYDAMEG